MISWIPCIEVRHRRVGGRHIRVSEIPAFASQHREREIPIKCTELEPGISDKTELPNDRTRRCETKASAHLHFLHFRTRPRYVRASKTQRTRPEEGMTARSSEMLIKRTMANPHFRWRCIWLYRHPVASHPNGCFLRPRPSNNMKDPHEISAQFPRAACPPCPTFATLKPYTL